MAAAAAAAFSDAARHLIADGICLECFFCLFFWLIDGETLTHGSKMHWNKQQHRAL